MICAKKSPHFSLLLVGIATTLASPVAGAKPLAPQPSLNPAVTQAIQKSATAVTAVNVASSAPASATQPIPVPSNLPIATDDGGEVDIVDNQLPPDVAVGSVAPAIQPTNQFPNQTLPTQTPSQDTRGTGVNEAIDAAPIAQVALGAVSPTTVAKFVKTIDVVRQQYVNTVDDEQLFDNAIAGVLTQLDPYSEYLDKQAFDNLRLFTEGDIGSIGVTVRFRDDLQAWVFSEVLPNSPAAQAGIQRNDYLHQINDNKLTAEQTQQDIDQLLSGIAGTQLRLVVSDSGRRKRTVTVQRTLVQQQTLNARVVQGVAIVQIPIFQNNTQQQLLTALAGLDAPFGAIVLDLRNNPGGVLSAANDVASLFMNNRPVAQVRNRQGLQEIIKTYGNARLADVPLAILQNRYSASAAEVLSSSLQENGRAKIYGETSYGKGSIQSIVPINEDEAVKLTVAHYYSGSGKKIDGVGVRPNITLTGSELDWENQTLASVLSLPRPKLYQLAPNHEAIQAF